MIQPVNGEDLVREFAVAGDDAGPQPVKQTFVGQGKPQGELTAVFLRFFQDFADKTVHPLRPQVEGEQLRIVLFQDEFHCLSRFPQKMFHGWASHQEPPSSVKNCNIP